MIDPLSWFHHGSYGIQDPSQKTKDLMRCEIQDPLVNFTMGSDGIIDTILHFHERFSGTIDPGMRSMSMSAGHRRAVIRMTGRSFVIGSHPIECPLISMFMRLKPRSVPDAQCTRPMLGKPGDTCRAHRC